MIFPVRGYCSAAFAIVLVAVTGACSYTVKPGNVPLAGTNEAISLAGISVLVKNAEQSSEDTAIPTDRKSSSGLKANRQAWSRKLVEAFAGELARRGAQVRANAVLVLSLSLPGIVFHEDRTSSFFTIKAQAGSSTGWSKLYEVSAKTEKISGTGQADKLAGQALAEVVRAMLGDSELQAQLLKK